MAKLTKAQRKAHAEACKILQKDALSIDEKIFVLENWHEGAEHMNGAIATGAGALVELIDAAGDAHAILTNVLAHQGGTMTAADRRSRGELAQRLHSILDALHGVQGCGGGR